MQRQVFLPRRSAETHDNSDDNARYNGVDSDSDPVPPNLVEYALRKPWLWVLTVLNNVRVLFVLCTQHFAKADEAVAEEALSTLVAAYSGFFPFMSILFLENSMNRR